MVEVLNPKPTQGNQERDCASAGQAAPPEAIAKQFAARQLMVEGDGFEPSYAEAARFTV